MSNHKTILIACSFFIVLASTPELMHAEEFPLSAKGCQATITRLEGVNSSKALAVGEVKRENAQEYCDRDPGGVTTQYGGKLTQEQCIQKVLQEEKGKLYSVSADCPRKTITTVDGRIFTAVGKDSSGEYIWRNNQTGQVLEASNASGAPVLNSQFRLLCPAYTKR